MSNSIQKINEIAPMTEQGTSGKVADPSHAEYLEGKGLLERKEIGLAAVALHNALVGFEEKGDETGVANASHQLGRACMQRQDYDKAIAHFKRAEEICKELGDPLSLLALSKQFIIAYTESGQYREAISRCLHILELYQANNNPKGSVETLEQMAEVYIRAGEKSKAADTFKTVASIHRNFKHDRIAESFLKRAVELEEKT